MIGRVGDVGHICRIILVKPRNGGCLNPGCWLWLNWFDLLSAPYLHKAIELADSFQTAKLFLCGNQDNSALLMNVHHWFNSSAVNLPRILYRLLWFQIQLLVHFIKNFQQILFHHDCGWFWKFDPLIEVHSLSWCWIPDLLRYNFAQPRVNFFVRELKRA